MPIVKSVKKQRAEAEVVALRDIGPGVWVSLSPNTPVWHDSEITGIMLDAFRPENKSVQLPDDMDEEDLGVIRSAIKEGMLVVGVIKTKQGDGTIPTNDPIEFLEFDVKELEEIITHFGQAELEAMLHHELNDRSRRDYIECLKNKIQEYASELVITDMSTNEEIYHHNKDLVKGSKTNREGDPDLVEVKTVGQPKINLDK